MRRRGAPAAAVASPASRLRPRAGQMLLLPVLALAVALRAAGALDLKALACRRVYSSEQADNGTVASPGYPRPYPPDTRCVYEFEGRPSQRVQLDFSDFSLYHPLEHPDDCDDVDALVAYARAGDRVHEIDRFCGSSALRPIMSSGPLLTLEFRGLHAGLHARGFLATYTFVENFGITTGQQLSDHPCSFAFNSSASRSGSFASPNFPGLYPRDTECHFLFFGVARERVHLRFAHFDVEGIRPSRSGSFASPNFPGLYPRDTECHFLFFGVARERVHLRFAHFDVEGIRPCSDISASDFVEFSNFYGPDRKYERKCGELKGFEVDSDRKFFRVTFRSNDRLDGTGFNATYQFLDEEDSFTVQKVSRDARGGSSRIRSWYLLLTPLLWIVEM